MIAWLRKALKATRPQRLLRQLHVPLRVRGRYDAAATTAENRRHWANADLLSANAANSPEVRKILRARARYEVANNSYAFGIVNTLANDCVGTGPRLQLLTSDAQANQRIEGLFGQWAKRIRLAEKLRTMRIARVQDGEAFALMVTNPALPTPVKLDLRLIEADQVTTPDLNWQALNSDSPYGLVDGIVFDQLGNPVEYHILRIHPGETTQQWMHEYDRVPAEQVIHWFRPFRPGQVRGIPEITPALPLFAQLRRYTLAVIAAAETAADFAAVIWTDAPPAGETADIEPMDLVELERRMATVLPGGWKLGQIQAQQPSTTYAEFKKEILNEIARCLNVPFNVAAGNSSGYNYASGRLDHQTYYKSLRVDQADLENVVLERVLTAWLDEAVLVPGLLPDALGPFQVWPHQWFWPGQEHVDPLKEATAQATRLAAHTTTLAYEYARQGRDWEEALRQRARELALMRELGLDDGQVLLPDEREYPEEEEV